VLFDDGRRIPVQARLEVENGTSLEQRLRIPDPQRPAAPIEERNGEPIVVDAGTPPYAVGSIAVIVERLCP
jgi:hypothetical protein